MADAPELIPLCRARLADIRTRMVACLQRMEPADLAWRPNPESNSAANLVLHICGNLRQRYRAQIGGEPDVRRRDAEFADRGDHTAAELVAMLEAGFADADAVLARLAPARLAETVVGRDGPEPIAGVVLSTLIHYGEHLGQLIFIAKARRGAVFGTLSIPLPERH